MVYVNSPERYVPIGSHDEYVPVGGLSSQVVTGDGLYFPVRGTGEPEVIAAERAAAILAAPTEATLQDYQYWAESGWKTHHGTYASTMRFGEKEYEEHQELTHAFRRLDRHDAKRHPKALRQALLGELGDNLWCVTAQASNASAGLDESMKNVLFAYIHGTQHLTSKGQVVSPPWRGIAASLATKEGLITIDDIDRLMAARFEPRPSPVMTIDANEFDADLSQHIDMLLYNISGAWNAGEQQYAYGEVAVFNGKVAYNDPESYRQMGALIGELAATSVLEIAFIGRWAVGHKLRAIVEHNVTKISGRISLGLVDKSDGPRPDALR